HRRQAGALPVHRAHAGAPRRFRRGDRGQGRPQEELAVRHRSAADAGFHRELLRQDQGRQGRTGHRRVHDHRAHRKPDSRPGHGRRRHPRARLHRCRRGRHSHPQSPEDAGRDFRVLQSLPWLRQASAAHRGAVELQAGDRSRAHRNGRERGDVLVPPSARRVPGNDGSGEVHPAARPFAGDRLATSVHQGHPRAHSGDEVMHAPADIFKLIRAQGLRFFTGVPDSLLADFCAYVTDHAPAEDHVITANEGNAVALATGHYPGSGEPAVGYMQNSGLGNTVNPLLSLADQEVYSIPMLLMIGWRGEPGVKDEPQHVKQGRVMTAMLDSMEIPWFVLEASTADPAAVIRDAVARMRKDSMPVALLVRKDTFQKYKLQKDVVTSFPMNREGAVKCVVDLLSADDVVVATTGKTSRELYEYRAARGDGHGNDFLTVGAMGHTASIAMGVARTQPARRV